MTLLIIISLILALSLGGGENLVKGIKSFRFKFKKTEQKNICSTKEIKRDRIVITMANERIDIGLPKEILRTALLLVGVC